MRWSSNLHCTLARNIKCARFINMFGPYIYGIFHAKLKEMCLPTYLQKIIKVISYHKLHLDDYILLICIYFSLHFFALHGLYFANVFDFCKGEVTTQRRSYPKWHNQNCAFIFVWVIEQLQKHCWVV